MNPYDKLKMAFDYNPHHDERGRFSDTEGSSKGGKYVPNAALKAKNERIAGHAGEHEKKFQKSVKGSSESGRKENQEEKKMSNSIGTVIPHNKLDSNAENLRTVMLNEGLTDDFTRNPNKDIRIHYKEQKEIKGTKSWAIDNLRRSGYGYGEKESHELLKALKKEDSKLDSVIKKPDSIALNVPYENKDIVKNNGGKWDSINRKWNVSRSSMNKELEQFLPEKNLK